jgi:hypothetical protein
MAFNNKSSFALDFTGIDRVVQTAERHGKLVALQLATQQGYCSDGHFKDAAWYAGGYRAAFDDDGRDLERLSYWDYLHQVVPRYASSPALAWWTLVTEPEASTCAPGYVGADCYAHLTCDEASAAATLRGFFDQVGGEVRKLDPGHLVSSGTMASGQCGTAGADLTYVHQSPQVAICEARWYGTATATVPSGILDAQSRCAAAGKALVVGEAGFNAGAGCQSTVDRAAALRQLVPNLRTAGVDGLLLWQWGFTAPSCGGDVLADDPLWAVL